MLLPITLTAQNIIPGAVSIERIQRDTARTIKSVKRVRFTDDVNKSTIEIQASSNIHRYMDSNNNNNNNNNNYYDFTGRLELSPNKPVLSKNQKIEDNMNRRKPIDGRDNEYLYEVRWEGHSMSVITFEPLKSLKISMDAVIECELTRQDAEDTRRGQPEVPDTRGYQPTPVTATVQPYDDKCRECIKTMTDTMRYIHDYLEHSIPVPIVELTTALTVNLYEVNTKNNGIYQEINEKRIKGNQNRGIPAFTTGDKGYLMIQLRGKGYPGNCMTKGWRGPYIVTERLYTVNHRI